MDKLEFTKTITDLLVSTSVSAVIFNAIKITTPPNTKLLGKVSIGLGGLVLSNMVGDFATAYVRNTIDDAVEKYKEVALNVVVIQERMAAE